jgi:hypothetical protein
VAATAGRRARERAPPVRAFPGIDPAIRPGLQQVRVHLHVDAPDTSREQREQREELIALVENRSPIRDTLVSPVDVVTTLACLSAHRGPARTTARRVEHEQGHGVPTSYHGCCPREPSVPMVHGPGHGEVGSEGAVRQDESVAIPYQSASER